MLQMIDTHVLMTTGHHTVSKSCTPASTLWRNGAVGVPSLQAPKSKLDAITYHSGSSALRLRLLLGTEKCCLERN